MIEGAFIGALVIPFNFAFIEGICVLFELFLLGVLQFRLEFAVRNELRYSNDIDGIGRRRDDPAAFGHISRYRYLIYGLICIFLPFSCFYKK